jgi:hypothetical protein
LGVGIDAPGRRDMLSRRAGKNNKKPRAGSGAG